MGALAHAPGNGQEDRHAKRVFRALEHPGKRPARQIAVQNVPGNAGGNHQNHNSGEETTQIQGNVIEAGNHAHICTIQTPATGPVSRDRPPELAKSGH